MYIYEIRIIYKSVLDKSARLTSVASTFCDCVSDKCRLVCVLIFVCLWAWPIMCR